MLVIKLVLALLAGIAIAFLAYFYFRSIFDIPYGPLIRVSPDQEDRRRWWSECLRGVVRIVGFYAVVGIIFLATGGGLSFVLKAPPERTVSLFLMGLLTAALTRILAVVYSGFMIEALLPLALGFIALFVTQGLTNRPVVTSFIDDFIKLVQEPEFPDLVYVGLAVIPAGVELLLRTIQGRLPRSREVSFNLIREYYEGFETQEIVFSRQEVNKLYINTIKDEIEGQGLSDLRWISFSGTRQIAEAILQAIAANLALGADELHKARSKLVKLSNANKVRILMPTTPASRRQLVRDVLGVEPAAIPSVGTLRFMVINKKVVILALPIPPGIEEEGGLSSNVAAVTRNPLRVQEYLSLCDSLWGTRP